MLQILFTVFLVQLNSCEASCFGKDAHFKTTDVSRLLNLLRTWVYCFSNLWWANPPRLTPPRCSCPGRRSSRGPSVWTVTSCTSGPRLGTLNWQPRWLWLRRMGKMWQPPRLSLSSLASTTSKLRVLWSNNIDCFQIYGSASRIRQCDRIE